MNKVFHLNVQFGKINTDLYFEDKETAENIATLLKEISKGNAKTPMKINATIHQVLSKEAVAENVRTGLWLIQFSGKN